MNIQNCMYFSKNKKIRKKVLTFAGGGVIITKLSARATVHEFFLKQKNLSSEPGGCRGLENCLKKLEKVLDKSE